MISEEERQSLKKQNDDLRKKIEAMTGHWKNSILNKVMISTVLKYKGANWI